MRECGCGACVRMLHGHVASVNFYTRALLQCGPICFFLVTRGFLKECSTVLIMHSASLSGCSESKLVFIVENRASFEVFPQFQLHVHCEIAAEYLVLPTEASEATQ